MTTTFQSSAKYLWSSESVTEGHPDKVCDQISDAVLDWCLTQTPMARVACESSVKSDEDNDFVWVYGEVTPLPPPDVVDGLVRRVLNEIGYTDRSFGTSGESAKIEIRLSGQSGDIAMGVNKALEAKAGDMTDNLDTGAGDQGMMVGFACDETPEYMPAAIAIAHRLTRRLAEVRKNGTLPWLRPDGKSQVTVEYHHGKLARVETVVISTQHAPEIEHDEIEREIKKHVILPVIESNLLDADTKYFVNPTGRFVIGGPFGDSGLTGRKIIVDTYGGFARHGGGAFSGKDPTKVDRSAAYGARWVAKHVVAAGLATQCEIEVAYAIGVAKPMNVTVECFGTETIPTDKISEAVQAVFDLRPAAIIKELDLRKPIYRQTASYGHMGRVDIDLPWEKLDRVDALKKAAGV